MYSWLLSATLASATPACTPADPAGWIASVRAKGTEAAYLCLALDDTADTAILAALTEETDSEEAAPGRRRLQRALALHVMQRLHEPADVVALRAVNADDRRLLRDAVQARRGRRSPVAQHEAVFEKFEWYAPDPRYTQRDLTDLDRANLAVIDKPPKAARPTPAEPGTAASAMPAVPDAPAEPAPTPSGPCGCVAATSAGSLVGLAGALAVVARRRRSS